MMRNIPGNIYHQFTVASLERLIRHRKSTSYNDKPHNSRLLYVAASALPYHISGYTTRTHEVIQALVKAGNDIRVMTRPGYPWDRSDRVQSTDDKTSQVDEIDYVHFRSPSKHRPLLMFVVQAAKAIREVAIREKVTTIHAASNHENALPALVAARQLGISFQYEMRGLWELTRASRTPGYENSPEFLRGLELEGFVAKNANRVLIISEQLKKFSQTLWAIPEDRFKLLPNCVEPSRFTLGKPHDIIPLTIGYAGSLISYEGLDVLIDAIHLLSARDIKVFVNIIGDGEARSELEKQVDSLKLSDNIRFLGRLSPDMARLTLKNCSLVCLPRKPYKVCEIVPPIKLVEALAMGKPVIVPDLPVFQDEMGEKPGGWFFKAGDINDLANVIERAFADNDLLYEMSKKAREYAVSKRCWADFVPNVVSGVN